MYNTTPLQFSHFEEDGLASFVSGSPGNVTILLEMPNQTPTGQYRAVIWDRSKFECLDIVEACTFTEAALLAAEFYPDAELTDAAREQLQEEQMVAA